MTGKWVSGFLHHQLVFVSYRKTPDPLRASTSWTFCIITSHNNSVTHEWKKKKNRQKKWNFCCYDSKIWVPRIYWNSSHSFTWHWTSDGDCTIVDSVVVSHTHTHTHSTSKRGTESTNIFFKPRCLPPSSNSGLVPSQKGGWIPTIDLVCTWWLKGKGRITHNFQIARDFLILSTRLSVSKCTV